MDKIDVQLLRELEQGVPPVPAPFEEIGERIGISGTEVLERIRRLKAEGIIRKIRARIDQRRLGITANALVAWKLSERGEDDPGSLLASFPQVTHCYERKPVPGRWEYTHYTVHHGYNREQVLDEVRSVAEHAGCPDHVVLFSTREFKRVPNVRMPENGGDIP